MATIVMRAYAPALANLLGGSAGGGTPAFDYLTDDIRALLTTSSYSPNYATHDFKDDVTNEVSGAGYTAGGLALSAKTLTVTAANDWAKQRANATAYAVNEVVRPAAANGFLYRCVVAGTSGGSAPTYPTTIGDRVVDGTVTWECAGVAIVVLDAADLVWDPSTITGARRVVVYNNTPATDATRPLLSCGESDSDLTSNTGPITISFGAEGVLYFLT